VIFITVQLGSCELKELFNGKAGIAYETA